MKISHAQQSLMLINPTDSTQAWIIQVVTFSFKQVLSDKLHSTLVIKPVSSKKISHAQQCSMLSNPTDSTRSPTAAETSIQNQILQVFFATVAQ